MVEAETLLEILGGLEGLVERRAGDPVPRGEGSRAALDQALAALNLTKAYIADQTRGRPADRQREQQLSMAWTRAANTLDDVDPELAERCRLGDQHWVNPTSWDEREVEEARNAIDGLATEIRTLLSE